MVADPDFLDQLYRYGVFVAFGLSAVAYVALSAARLGVTRSRRRERPDGLRRDLPDRPAAAAGDRADPAGGAAGLLARVDVRLPHPLGGAVRHLRADARGDRADHRRPVRDQPGHARPERHRLAVRDAQRGLRQPHDLRDRARRLGAPRAGPQADDARRDRARDPRDQGARRGPRDRDAGGRGADPVGAGRQARRLDGRLRAEGARAGRPQGRRVHPPARRPGDPRVDARARARRRGGGRPRPGLAGRLRRRAGLRRRRPRPRARPVPLVRRDGRQPRRRPRPPLRGARRDP